MARLCVISRWELTVPNKYITWLYSNITVEGLYRPSFILAILSVSSTGLTALKVSKILKISNYWSNSSVICILAR